MAIPLHKNPCSRGHEIYKFNRPFLGHYYYILGQSDLCLGVEKKIVEEIMHLHYSTYLSTPQHKNPFPRGHEIYKFGRPFLGYHYYKLGLSNLCLGVEKKIVKEIIHFHCIIYMTTPQQKNTCPRGHEIYKFGGPFLDYHYYILGLSNLCLGVEKIVKEIMHFHNMSYMAKPQQKNTCPGGHEIYNFRKPFLVRD